MEESDRLHKWATDSFLEINRKLVAGDTVSLEQALGQLVGHAVANIDGCEWAAVTSWPENKAPQTLATSDHIATRVDEIQHELLEGPCLHAAADSLPITIPDLRSDQRWPRFAGAVLDELPVRAALAYPLDDGANGRMALNLFAGQSHAFDNRLEQSAVFASQANALTMHAQTAVRAAQFQSALESNRRIAMAMGVLMATQKVQSDVALEMLKAASNRRRRKVIEIASYVVETGELPD